ncbi:MAG TPA: FlgD immunoglobulin-like domain containing protein [Flavitalea sp.]|nr:FlgD immunoglobulin-like domain containing protein [Flavitalea sp.]
MKQSNILSCLIAVLLFFFLPGAFGQSSTTAISFSFTLSTSSKTSAGIYKPDSTLIRTLWSGKTFSAGQHTSIWDGKDDDGNYVADGNYIAKVLSNNVNYVWEGVLGNTSLQSSGSSVHHPMQMITNMVQIGNEMYFAVGYNEQGQAHGKFTIGSPNVVTTSYRAKAAALRFLAADVNKVYFGGQAWEGNPVTFVSALDPNPSGVDAMASFSSGTAVTNGATTYSALNVVNDPDYITGIAVQDIGNFLFTTNSSLNRLTVYNKNTGQLLQNLGYASARDISCSNTDLWMIIGANTVSKYPINSDGTLGTATVTLSGLIDPLALRLSPDGSKIAVVDRGIYHQVKFYDTNNGQLAQTVGRAENYSNPTVYDDKFYFNNTRIFSETNYGSSHAFVAFQSDGSFWVGDYGNMRCQHFAANGNYIDNIQYMGYSYSSQTDINNPSRIFSDFLEFEIDYSKPLSPNNGSWKFVRNWSWNITLPTLYDANRMRSVTTLSNGRTYALYFDGPLSLELVELSLNTGIRHTGIHMESHYKCDLNRDGSVWQIGNNVPGQPTFWQKKLLTGFDATGNPLWGPYVDVETSPVVLATDPLTTDGYLRRNNQTSSGIVATFSADNGTIGRGTGWHLGGIKNGNWLFKTSRSTHVNYLGEFPDDGVYDIGNYVRNAGNYMQVVDRNIFWGYNGEFWKGLQTNKYNHYYENGLFVGQFGVAGNVAKESGIEAYPGMAGNANSGTYVKVGNDIYLYHCDENAHAGVHRWKISNLSSIQEQQMTVMKSGTPVQPVDQCTDLMAGLPYNQTLINGTGGWTRNLSDYNNSYYDQLLIATDRTTYKDNERDILLLSYPATTGKTVWIKRSLGPNNLPGWTLSGDAAWIEPSQGGDGWIDVLDNADRVIARLYRVDNWPNGSMKANNSTIVSGGLDVMFPVFNKLQPFSISASVNSVKITYANNPTVDVPVMDPLADITKPATLRIHTYSSNAAGHQMAIARLKFCPELYLLQVNFTSLRAYQKDNGIQLDWSLQSPEKIQTFEVERSINGRDFYLLGKVNGDIYSSDYGFFDSDACAGKNYYRIKILNRPGETSFSKVVDANINLGRSEFLVYPNPIKNFITVKLVASVKGEYITKLVNNTGQVILSGKIIHAGGSATYTFAVPPHLSKGEYYLQISGNAHSSIRQITR